MSHINLAIIGTISAGKSTLLNALVTDHLSETHIKKTTLLPHIFHESGEPVHTKQYIRLNTTNHTDQFNENMLNGSVTKLEELHYNIGKIQNFIEFKKHVSLNIYDIPGLNDSETKKLYYEYMTKIFKQLNIILWTVDINSSINTSDEIDILEFLLSNIKENKTKYQINTKLIILLNKCDDMCVDESTNELVLDGDRKDMYDQAKKIIDSKILKNYPECKYDMMPISSINAYIYRMIQNNKLDEIDETHMNILGTTEYSKIEWKGFSDKEKKEKILIKLNSDIINLRINNTGFNNIKSCIQKHINELGEVMMLFDVIKSEIIQTYDSCADKKTEYNLSYFSEIKDKIERLKSEYNNVIPYDTINHTMTLYYHYIHLMVLIYETDNAELINIENIPVPDLSAYKKGDNYDCENIPDILINKYYRAVRFYDYLYTFFDTRQTFKGCEKLLSLISNYLIKCIDSEDSFDGKINILCREQIICGQPFPKVLMSCFNSAIIHCFTSNNITGLSDYECIKIIMDIKTRFNLSKSNILCILLGLIDIRYANYFNESKISHIIRRAKFWDDLIIKPSSIYSLHLFNMKKMLDRYIMMNQINTTNDTVNDTERMVIELEILNMIPGDFMNKDDLF
jgi:GTPase SAR1 family protein